MAKEPVNALPTVSVAADPRAELEVALKAARLASPVIAQGDRAYAFVPDGYSLKDISDPARLPDRVRQSVAFDDRASLVAFVNRFSNADTVLFADFNSLTITAAIDFHTSNEPQVEPRAVDFTAKLTLLPSEEFLRWDKMEGVMHPQEAFAEFLEENAVNIHTPDPATMIEISRELEASIGAVFKSKVSLENGDRSAFKDIRALREQVRFLEEIRPSPVAPLRWSCARVTRARRSAGFRRHSASRSMAASARRRIARCAPSRRGSVWWLTGWSAHGRGRRSRSCPV